MIKRLVILVAFALGVSAALQATTVDVTCTLMGGSDPATYMTGGTNTTLDGVTMECPAFSVPAGDTLTGVEMEIVNSFSNGIPGQTNTIWFTYTVSGFDAVSTLTSYVSSNASTASDGVASDLGGILNQSGTGCAATAATLIVCNEITPVTTSLTVTASSAWVAGGLLMAGGSDGAAVMESYTYVPTVVSTPEPGGLVLLGSGLLGLGCFFRRKRMM